MKPYYEQNGITIYNADCRDVLPILQGDYIVVTDPPYGVELASHRGAAWAIKGDSNEERLGVEAVIEEVLARFPVIAFASPKRPWPGTWDQHLVWNKGGAVGGGGDVGSYWKLSWELIQANNLGRLNPPRDESVLTFPVGPQNSAAHPARKPVALLEYLISKLRHSSILDPFCGTGTTLRAAVNLGRPAVGVEVEEAYCHMAAESLRQLVLV